MLIEKYILSTNEYDDQSRTKLNMWGLLILLTCQESLVVEQETCNGEQTLWKI